MTFLSFFPTAQIYVEFGRVISSETKYSKLPANEKFFCCYWLKTTKYNLTWQKFFNIVSDAALVLVFFVIVIVKNIIRPLMMSWINLWEVGNLVHLYIPGCLYSGSVMDHLCLNPSSWMHGDTWNTNYKCSILHPRLISLGLFKGQFLPFQTHKSRGVWHGWVQ